MLIAPCIVTEKENFVESRPLEKLFNLFVQFVQEFPEGPLGDFCSGRCGVAAARAAHGLGRPVGQGVEPEGVVPSPHGYVNIALPGMGAYTEPGVPDSGREEGRGAPKAEGGDILDIGDLSEGLGPVLYQLVEFEFPVDCLLGAPDESRDIGWVASPGQGPDNPPLGIVGSELLVLDSQAYGGYLEEEGPPVPVPYPLPGKGGVVSVVGYGAVECNPHPLSGEVLGVVPVYQLRGAGLSGVDIEAEGASQGGP